MPRSTFVALALALALALVAPACSPRQPSWQCAHTVHVAAKDGDVLWLGEMHGTWESPNFAGDVACTLARAGMRVQVGLEIWTKEQPALDQFLATGDRNALLAGPFWASHDGRSSEAMLALLDQMRLLRKQGARIEVFAYDMPDQPDRDAAMAQKVLALRDSTTVLVGLSGNIHSRKTKWNDQTPLVNYLLAARVPVKTFDVAAAGGTMWACMSEGEGAPVCGEHPNHGNATGGTPWTFGASRDDSHDGVYFVGTTKAAFPAKP